MSYESPSYDSPDPTLPPPPYIPPPPAAPPRRLVRDPYARLGGVASGVAHHYGIDVSIVRIVFVLTAFVTGFGFFAYLLAWLVIPRAEYWPPVGSPGSVRSLSGRELGIGLAVVGLLMALSFGASGGPGSILLPLALVAGGVWLLVQVPKESVGSTADPSGGAESGPTVSEPVASGPVSGPEDTFGYSSQGHSSPGPAPAPVPPASPRRRAGMVAVIGGVVLVVIAIPVLAIGALVFAASNGDFDIETETVRYTPFSIVDLQSPITADAGEVVIDLTELDLAELEGQTEAFDITANLDFGSIQVIVPDDMAVSIDASVDVGSVKAFGESDDGFANTIVIDNPEADVNLDLDLDVGEITVKRE